LLNLCMIPVPVILSAYGLNINIILIVMVLTGSLITSVLYFRNKS
jgi:hypothetical protein